MGFPWGMPSRDYGGETDTICGHGHSDVLFLEKYDIIRFMNVMMLSAMNLTANSLSLNQTHESDSLSAITCTLAAKLQKE